MLDDVGTSSSSEADRLIRRSARPFVVMGFACVVGGGLLSAAAAPSPSYFSSWVVAYLVLVGGVAQLAWGIGQATSTTGQVARRVWVFELVGWNLGNAAVIAGTVLNIVGLLYAGTALLVVVLVLVLVTTRNAHGRLPIALRVVVVVLLVSMPIGIVIHSVAH